MSINTTLSNRKVGIEGVEEFLWPTNDYNAFHWPLQDWVHGKSYFMKFVKDFNTIVQAGGCCGMYPRFYKNYFKTVYTFEPDPINFQCLEHNCTGPGYKIYNAALGSKEQLVSLTHPMTKGEENNVGMYMVSEKPGDINMITLDSLDVEHCDLLHLDIEGYETNALKGGIELISKFNPVVIVERESGKEFLESLGYTQRYRLAMDSVFVRN